MFEAPAAGEYVPVSPQQAEPTPAPAPTPEPNDEPLSLAPPPAPEEVAPQEAPSESILVRDTPEPAEAPEWTAPLSDPTPVRPAASESAAAEEVSPRPADAAPVESAEVEPPAPSRYDAAPDEEAVALPAWSPDRPDAAASSEASEPNEPELADAPPAGGSIFDEPVEALPANNAIVNGDGAPAPTAETPDAGANPFAADSGSDEPAGSIFDRTTDGDAPAPSDSAAAFEGAPQESEAADPLEAFLNDSSPAEPAASGAADDAPAKDQPAPNPSEPTAPQSEDDSPTADAFFGAADAEALLRSAGGLASASPRTWEAPRSDRRWKACLVAVTAEEAVFVQPSGYETRCNLRDLGTDDLRFVRRQLAARQWQIAHEGADDQEPAASELVAR